MNPDKLFDYLDGKLSPADRTALEERLMSDAQLRRQFEVAREIHRSSGGSREVIIPDPAEMERGGRLGRRIATAAIVLIMLNVLGGLAVITWKQSKPPATNSQEATMRRQLEQSLGAAGRNALPAPTFVEDAFVRLTAPRAQWDEIAARVTKAASEVGGSAAKGLADETGLTVMADVPSARRNEFRQLVAPDQPVPPSASTAPPSPNERTIIQVRIAEAAR